MLLEDQYGGTLHEVFQSLENCTGMGDVEGLIDGWAVGTGRGGSYLGPLRSSTLCWAIVAKRIKEVDGFRGIQKFWRDAKDFDACCSLTCRERMFIDVIVMITWE